MYSFTSPNWFVLNPVFSRVCRVCSLLCCAKLKQTAESCILFFSYFTKKQRSFFYCLCTQIKADLLQFRLSSWPRGVASTVRRGINPVIASARMRSQLSILPSQCSLFIIIIKNNRSNIWKKHTALFKYVVKSVLFSVITVPPWSYAKHFVLCGYCKGK